MDIAAKKDQLKRIYDDYETESRQFKEGAICKAGCAFCCIHFGKVDVITLEGLIISERVNSLSRPKQTDIRKKIAKNIRKCQALVLRKCQAKP